MLTRLSDLKPGQDATVVKILGHGAFRKRMLEMGFVTGRKVRVLLDAPLRDPVKYEIMDYEVSLRRSEAELVEVSTDEVGSTHSSLSSHTDESPVLEERGEVHHAAAHEHDGHSSAMRTINVALIGNPNCGKTSLFNIVSGAREHVGNYSGVTVDAKAGSVRYKNYRINIVDLPGTYSLASYSPEELYVRQYLRDETPDVIINVVDGSNLERNLYLTTELIDMDRSMVIALNMVDELERAGVKLDCKMLGEMIGVPIVPIAARTGRGINELLDTVIRVYEGTDPAVRHIHVNLGTDIEHAVTVLKDTIKANPHVGLHFSPRYLAIKLLEKDAEVEKAIKALPSGKEIIDLRDSLLAGLPTAADDINMSIANAKYGFIAGALAETMETTKKEEINSTRIIDTIVTNRLFGFPIFLGIMFFIFWATFELGSYPMEWIEGIVGWLGDLTREYLPDGAVKDLIADGIIGGVGGVIVFLPNILILYLCISFMEDSGYMARAAFIMDKVMHRLGLHGKSFIPLVMGFGCTVPSIMASRSIESRSSRIITILINPFISCSARLPIYVLLIGTFFPNHATLVFMCIYLLGILMAGVTARLLRRFYFGEDVTPFVMELPPYRVPTLKATLRHMWGKGEQYLKKMGGIILVASIVVWALNYFPLHDGESAQEVSAETVADDSAIDPSRDSYLEMAGKAINPILEPIGFHWRASVAALAGVPAKEIVVSTLGVLYTGDEEASDQTLSTRLTTPNEVTGHPDFTAAAALSFMVFVLLYCPCIATVTAIIKETGNPRYGLFSVVYNTLLAWMVAFIVYRVALLF
ncbi:ferrous iron transport protein B [uncultured Duncaniella sp.]|uniref:ferrous iron transport protein B n=1 Tax=uncultured Duncaniella sp. TaxID=2768039 RepID=UPI0025A9D105|nr:ferrous iron transport protein B [uncultured Duncaniella sp.]